MQACREQDATYVVLALFFSLLPVVLLLLLLLIPFNQLGGLARGQRLDPPGRVEVLCQVVACCTSQDQRLCSFGQAAAAGCSWASWA